MPAIHSETRFDWSQPVKTGLLGGVAALLLSLIGVIEASHARPVISGIISLGQALLLIVFVLTCVAAIRRAGYARQETSSRGRLLLCGGVAGLMVSVALAALVLIGNVVNLRAVFIKASPELYHLLTLGLDTGGVLALLMSGFLLGIVVGATYLLPARLRRAIAMALGAIPLLAVLYGAFFPGRRFTLPGALALFVVLSAGSYWGGDIRSLVKQRVASLPPAGQRVYKIALWALVALLVLLLPTTGSYPSQMLDLVGLYILMGLGLNIVVGFAGLLDLGYVAFFAIGAYTQAVLTSPEIRWLGEVRLTFWEALPFSVLMATLAGVILGIPVLRMRGDYLAIVTLGFGEIIRIVALSDWLKPYIGGSNGITRIPKPVIGGWELATPGRLYYLIIAGCLLAAVIAARLKHSRLGRAWMAIREDEDVAQAMGIDLVRTKLLAFATGAAFSGLSGAIFAAMITSIYPHSFHLLVSINTLGLIIVGGMGSIPGVILGSLALVGLPEILREFSEYRLLIYGVALVYMMLVRPEGLLPEARRKLELHEAEAAE
ncbi:MAG: leucine/isoleucine/valine transporter permease subunit [Anaerolineae bacterium]|nr:leucine/isoleucine/valine transporter permease subunit [Anaerolineae bacterium]